jgi:hypothetical protein
MSIHSMAARWIPYWSDPWLLVALQFDCVLDKTSSVFALPPSTTAMPTPKFLQVRRLLESFI